MLATPIVYGEETCCLLLVPRTVMDGSQVVCTSIISRIRRQCSYRSSPTHFVRLTAKSTSTAKSSPPRSVTDQDVDGLPTPT